MLTRAQFLALTKLNIDDLNNTNRRGMLPFENREYSAFNALITNVMMNFHASPDGHGMSMELARNIVRAAIPAIEEQMPLIRDTSAVFRLDEGFKSVFIGRLTVGAFQGGPIAFCGTGADLAQLTTDGADILGIMLSNITAAAAVLRQRAERAGIDLAVELWGNAG